MRAAAVLALLLVLVPHFVAALPYRGSGPNLVSVARGGLEAPVRFLAPAQCPPPLCGLQQAQSSHRGPHNGLTIRDLIELSRAGLGEEVLLALIEVDRGVYAIDPDTLKALKAAGVTDRVIAALVRSGRDQPVPPPLPVWDEAVEAPAPSPAVVVIEHHAPEVYHVPVAVPVYVTAAPVHSRVRRADRVPLPDYSTFVPFQQGPQPFQQVVDSPKREPVYWGFGGKLRPDAWKPAGHKPDDKEDKKK